MTRQDQAVLSDIDVPLNSEAPALADDLLSGAQAIADYIGLPRRRIYSLAESYELPVFRINGFTLSARKSELDAHFSAKRPKLGLRYGG